ISPRRAAGTATSPSGNAASPPRCGRIRSAASGARKNWRTSSPSSPAPVRASSTAPTSAWMVASLRQCEERACRSGREAGGTVTEAAVADTDRSLTGWYREATPKVRRVFWTCAAAWGLDSMDGFVFQYMIPAIRAGLGITLLQAGSIASANYFAGAIGGGMGGWLADRYGRARVLKITILWFSFFSMLSGFAQDYNQLLVLRILHGFGFGAEWAVGTVLLGELVAPQHRGKAIGAVQSAAGPGSMLAALLGGPVAAALPIAFGWRVAFF